MGRNRRGRIHLILDGISSNEVFLRSLDQVSAWLVETTHAIGMTIVSGPWVVSHVNKGAYDEGVTGLLVLAESHIAIHTWPLLACVCIDIFSCKDFDVKKVVNSIIKSLGIVKHGYAIIERPLSMDQEVPFAQHVMLKTHVR